MENKYIDLTGKRFGKLVVVKFSHRSYKPNGHSMIMWKCKCDCGNFKITSSTNLKQGHTTSCGCVHRQSVIDSHKKHGMMGTRIYSTWHNMLSRCRNKHNKAYKNYGGRGINVCDEWTCKDGFMNFYNWAMANGYTDTLTIDRIDVNGDYEPSNCRWATRREQSNNKRENIHITYNGETHTISEWAEITGISYRNIYQRLIQTDWSIDKIFNTEPTKKEVIK